MPPADINGAAGLSVEGRCEKMKDLMKELSAIKPTLNTNLVDVDAVFEDIKKGANEEMTDTQLRVYTAETACYLATLHPDFSLLAGRIAVRTLHEATSESFKATIRKLFSYRNPRTGDDAPLVSQALHDFVMKSDADLDSVLKYERDYRYDYFGYKTLERSYLLRMEDESGVLKVVERPQHMLMRVALGLWCCHPNGDVNKAIDTYEELSRGTFTHASPTLFNCGTPRPQLSSCFLVAMKDDSLEGIFDTLKNCAMISKGAGGLGLSISNIRPNGSYIRGTNGLSNGIVPMLRVFDTTVRYVDQGGGKRKGACTIYLEPWHADILDFLQLRKNTGKDEHRARDLFQALWIPDLFMERVELWHELKKDEEKARKGEQVEQKNIKPEDITWSLFCPNECPGLTDSWGDEFRQRYEKYEKEGKHKQKVQIGMLWDEIVKAQIETGGPFMLYKDHANRKSNQNNLGTIRCSNLCTEIIEYSSAEETAVCNLASISLPNFIKDDGTYDFKGLYNIARLAARNLDRVIEVTDYPTPEAKRSNLRHRPMGLGVQGLADTFCRLNMPFTSPQARKLNKEIFETIYYGAMEKSCELAQELGAYETFENSLLAGQNGQPSKFQWELWLDNDKNPVQPSKDLNYDWEGLRARIKQYGVRNSLLVAPMPTASTSQILGNNECFEPYTTNMYIRRVLSGEYPVLNRHLVNELIKLGMWTQENRDFIISQEGSVKNLKGLPQEVKDKYLTVWEIKQKDLLEMHVDRCAFIDQSASMNIFIETPKKPLLTNVHLFGWKGGLKTGMYYLRTKPAAAPVKVTVPALVAKASATNDSNNQAASVAAPVPMVVDEFPVCTREMIENGCLSCGS